jgi:uncharacterized protein
LSKRNIIRVSNLEVRPSNHDGVGVFAKRQLQSGETIVEITGNIIHWRTVLEIGGIVQDNMFRFSAEYYLSPDGIGNYVNHSCDPNAGIYKNKNRLFLKSIKKIKRGQEIAFDYSTIIANDDIWTMKCKCGSPVCIKNIKNFGGLPQKVKKRYSMEGIVPKYIIQT